MTRIIMMQDDPDIWTGRSADVAKSGHVMLMLVSTPDPEYTHSGAKYLFYDLICAYHVFLRYLRSILRPTSHFIF